MDIIGDGILWKHIVDMLTNAPVDRNPFGIKIWTDGDQILVDTQKAADAIAGFLSAIGMDAHTGHYDYDEDKRSGMIDDHTGWFYIDVY